MSFATALPVADPPVAGGVVPGGALPGRRLLGLVQRMMRTGMAMARRINRIARQRMAGEDLARLAPAGFNPTATNFLVVEAVSWTAALRERLLALAGPRALAPGLPREERAPRGRAGATADLLTDCVAEVAEDPWHNWRELARPWRMGPGGVAFAARAIAGLSDREVVSQICDKLSRAATQLGAEADVARIAALEAAALALCPEAEDATEDAAAAAGGAEGDSDARDAESPSDQTKAKAGRDPPPD